MGKEMTKRQAAKVAQALGDRTGNQIYYSLRDYLLGRKFWGFPYNVGRDDEHRFMEWVHDNPKRAWSLWRSVQDGPGMWQGNWFGIK